MAALSLTALGLVTPLGLGKAANAEALFAGSRHGLVPSGDLLPGRSVPVGAVTAPLPPVPPALQPWDSRNNRLLLAAALEIEAAVAAAVRRWGADRVAIVVGTSTSGIGEGAAALGQQLAGGGWPASFDYRQQETGSAAGFLARALGLTGPAYVVATACSSSAKAMAAGRRLIRAGLCDAAVVGGGDSLCRLTLAGFAALESLSDTPCNPFSRNRDGITIGEGAALFLMSREPGPVALLGVGESSDAHHISAPDPAGGGALAAMTTALDDAGLAADAIGYINLHGTATALNDAMESLAVHALFGAAVPCSSTKPMTGHTLGAAGAVEAAFLWLTLHPSFNPDRRLPPHLWDGAVDPALAPLALTRPGARLQKDRPAVLSNSFAFGGSNCSLVLGCTA